MVALLTVEKQRLLAANGRVTTSDFREAWETCWEIMVIERAWAHKTSARRSAREALEEVRAEMAAAFLDRATPFSIVVGRLTCAASNMCLRLESRQIPDALLAAIAYAERNDDAAEVAA